MPTLILGHRATDDGLTIPAFGFEHNGMFIVDPDTSDCGRFPVLYPLSHYGLTAAQLAALRIAHFADQHDRPHHSEVLTDEAGRIVGVDIHSTMVRPDGSSFVQVEFVTTMRAARELLGY